MWASWSQARCSLKECRRIHLASAVKLRQFHLSTPPRIRANLCYSGSVRRVSRVACFYSSYTFPLGHQCVALPLAINSLQTLYREWRNTAHPLLGPAQHLLFLFQSYCDPYFVLLHHKEAYIGLQTNHRRKHFWRSLDTI